jgi:hypothetical protein
MSVYFVVCVEKKPEKLEISLKNSNLQLKELSKDLLPEFWFEAGKKYFYYIDGSINFKLLKEPDENSSIDEVFIWKFQKERNELFKAVLEWCLIEIGLGNKVSLIQQVETDDREEWLRYNTVYERKNLSLSNSINLQNDFNFGFNVEYEIIE